MNTRKGNALYTKAKTLIPGGTQLLSKRPELFLPELWPAYYAKAKGAAVTDLDGNEYIDMSINGIGACILGFADPDVDGAVAGAIARGTMCTLNCPEEVELAELLIELHPWAEMVRYARCGGEAMAMAVRIARAATGRDKIAFCGYHGWHDWYLATNLAGRDNLNGQLLPGLEPNGVPRGLAGTALPFHYGNSEELETILTENRGEIAAIVMEPVRQLPPDPEFLRKVRSLADRHQAVLIFDEVTAAWRMNVGGIHLLYGVTPDLAAFAKGISNGFPMAAVLGRREVMEACQKSFISSTYWTERIGPVAALATIRKMRQCQVPAHLIRTGEAVRAGWQETADRHGLPIKIMGIPPLSILALELAPELLQTAATFFTQEMLKKGFLASRAFYATYAHTADHVRAYLAALDQTFAALAGALRAGSLPQMLEGPVAMAGFKRVN